MTDRVTEPTLRFTVPEALGGRRFDVVLAALAPEYSRARLQEWIRDGRATLRQRSRRPRDPVAAGDPIELRPPAVDSSPLPHPAQPIELSLLYEDEDLLVVDKPAGLVVHPGAGRPDRTLVNALLHHEPRLAAVPRAGVVHRLDKGTSGLLVVARTLRAHRGLVNQLAARTVHREYLAVVRGRVISGGTVDAPIGRHPTHRTRMAVVPRSGRAARTHFRVAARYRAHTALSVRLDTGRTHQIRVHLAHRGTPVVGDPDYGGRAGVPCGATARLADTLRRFGRQALHARTLALIHPISGDHHTWTAPLPEDLARLLAVLADDASPREREAAGEKT